MTILCLVLPAQGVWTDVDPNALLDSADRKAMERLEVEEADAFVRVQSIVEDGGLIRSRRDAMGLTVRGTLSRTRARDGERWVARVDASVVLRWGAFFAPSPRALVPRQEKTRRRRCHALVMRLNRRLQHRDTVDRVVVPTLRRHRLAALFSALGCDRVSV